MASSNLHRVFSIKSFKLAFASADSSSPASSLWHSESSFKILSSQWQLVAPFAIGGTNGGSSGDAPGSVFGSGVGADRVEERVKN